MEKNVKLKANVFEREQYKNNIDTTFSQLTSSVFTQTPTSSINIPEFFDKYNTLFFDIPKKGSTSDDVLPSGSHELIARDFNPINNPAIQDLLQQIIIIHIQQEKQNGRSISSHSNNNKSVNTPLKSNKTIKNPLQIKEPLNLHLPVTSVKPDIARPDPHCVVNIPDPNND